MKNLFRKIFRNLILQETGNQGLESTSVKQDLDRQAQLKSFILGRFIRVHYLEENNRISG